MGVFTRRIILTAVFVSLTAGTEVTIKLSDSVLVRNSTVTCHVKKLSPSVLVEWSLHDNENSRPKITVALSHGNLCSVKSEYNQSFRLVCDVAKKNFNLKVTKLPKGDIGRKLTCSDGRDSDCITLYDYKPVLIEDPENGTITVTSACMPNDTEIAVKWMKIDGNNKKAEIKPQKIKESKKICEEECPKNQQKQSLVETVSFEHKNGGTKSFVILAVSYGSEEVYSNISAFEYEIGDEGSQDESWAIVTVIVIVVVVIGVVVGVIVCWVKKKKRCSNQQNTGNEEERDDSHSGSDANLLCDNNAVPGNSPSEANGSVLSQNDQSNLQLPSTRRSDYMHNTYFMMFHNTDNPVWDQEHKTKLDIEMLHQGNKQLVGHKSECAPQSPDNGTVTQHGKVVRQVSDGDKDAEEGKVPGAPYTTDDGKVVMQVSDGDKDTVDDKVPGAPYTTDEGDEAKNCEKRSCTPVFLSAIAVNRNIFDLKRLLCPDSTDALHNGQQMTLSGHGICSFIDLVALPLPCLPNDKAMIKDESEESLQNICNSPVDTEHTRCVEKPKGDKRKEMQFYSGGQILNVDSIPSEYNDHDVSGYRGSNRCDIGPDVRCNGKDDGGIDDCSKGDVYDDQQGGEGYNHEQDGSGLSGYIDLQNYQRLDESGSIRNIWDDRYQHGQYDDKKEFDDPFPKMSSNENGKRVFVNVSKTLGNTFVTNMSTCNEIMRKTFYHLPIIGTTVLEAQLCLN